MVIHSSTSKTFFFFFAKILVSDGHSLSTWLPVKFDRNWISHLKMKRMNFFPIHQKYTYFWHTANRLIDQQTKLQKQRNYVTIITDDHWYLNNEQTHSLIITYWQTHTHLLLFLFLLLSSWHNNLMVSFMFMTDLPIKRKWKGLRSHFLN